ncbi:hypothetical protein OESDEN_11220 [Oesophagostomum dentatum]|uniref:Reverse transcriptase domain-containing protein n=1 Tax=Oesophagostomum dentatum TaxID=61180 RepID=A0A0B1SUH1_OESDE|nr:hypothetical protein OESDEN_11220 [Oesophagostomum dentatum]
MLMGLKGAQATFQRIMDDFKKYLGARVFIYIDDLIITSEKAEQHLVDIDEVLGKVEFIGMKLNASKCTITILGFVTNNDGIRPNPDKTKAIDAYPTPRNITDIKSFWGCAHSLDDSSTTSRTFLLHLPHSRGRTPHLRGHQNVKRPCRNLRKP